MKLQGLKVNFLGDSITEGNKGPTDLNHRFTAVLHQKYGVDARNYGAGGTRIALQSQPSQEARFDLDFLMRSEKMDRDAEVVFIFGGTNDFGHGMAPLGNWDERTDYTFTGACRHLMEKVLAFFPTAEIAVVTPLHRIGEEDPYGDHVRDFPTASLKTYATILRETAEYYSLPVLDLFAESGFQPSVEAIGERYFLDGLHPNDAGHARLADLFARYLIRL